MHSIIHVEKPFKLQFSKFFAIGQFHGNKLQIRDFGLLFNHFVLYSYDFSQFEYFYMVQRYQLNHKFCQSSLLFYLETSEAYVIR